MANKSIDLMKRMGMFAPNFLNEIKGGTQNNAPMVSLNELNAKSLINRHTKDGYVIVSPCRGADDFGLDKNNPTDVQKLSNINKQRIREFIDILKQSGFSYTPVYGGFIENKGEENEEHVYERSFVIYPYDKNGNLREFNELYDFALEMCRKYNQDSVLVAKPNETPKYITKDNNVDMEFSGDVTFNDVSQEYFTDLHKNTNKYDMTNRKPTRFTFEGCYLNPSPQCYSERHVRYLMGEKFLS
jgi:hypothetical protein